MSRGDDDEDPWDVLGVTPDDDDATVRAAYARLLRQFRPEPHDRHRLDDIERAVRPGNRLYRRVHLRRVHKLKDFGLSIRLLGSPIQRHDPASTCHV